MADLTSTMRAMATPTYGPLTHIAAITVPLPTPGRGQVRVRVAASALNPADFKVALGEVKLLHGRRKPLRLGYDYAGVIDAIGPAVTAWAVGDEVFGFLAYGPATDQGAFAEALIAQQDELARKPPAVSFAVAAAAATTGLTALQALRDLGRLPARDGQVLVTGVSGGVGSIAVGIAGRLGASVTAVGSGAGLEAARLHGAAEVWDRSERAIPGEVRERFDVVFDAAAAYRWSTWRAALRAGGAFVTTLPSLAFATDKLASLLQPTRVHVVTVRSRRADLELLASWLEGGLAVPLSDTIPVRDVGAGLERLRQRGGRTAVVVAEGF